VFIRQIGQEAMRIGLLTRLIAWTGGAMRFAYCTLRL
jgi:hypothetical protein